MNRKFILYAFAAAILAAFSMGVSQAADYGQGTTGSDRTTTPQDRSATSRGKETKEIKMNLGPAPQVSTKAKGETEFKLEDNGKALSYEVKVDDLKDITMAHVHMVRPDGSPGEVIAPLFPEVGTGALPSGEKREGSRVKEGEFSGKLSEGKLTPEQFTGSMKGKSAQEMYDLLRTGKAGVNVHTKQNPNGEVWGTSQMSSTAGEGRSR
jgi:hypothetical protein